MLTISIKRNSGVHCHDPDTRRVHHKKSTYRGRVRIAGAGGGRSESDVEPSAFVCRLSWYWRATAGGGGCDLFVYAALCWEVTSGGLMEELRFEEAVTMDFARPIPVCIGNAG